MGLASRCYFNEQLTVGRAFGAPGTPSAVLIDEQGQIASELAVGPPRVLALIRAPSGWQKDCVGGMIQEGIRTRSIRPSSRLKTSPKKSDLADGNLHHCYSSSDATSDRWV